MDLSSLEKKLLAAARQAPPSEAVPYAFEKRVMARLAAAPPLDEWLAWSRGLWRAALSCVAVAAVLGFWSLRSDPVGVRAGAEDLAQDFESTVLASAQQHLEDLW